MTYNGRGQRGYAPQMLGNVRDTLTREPRELEIVLLPGLVRMHSCCGAQLIRIGLVRERANIAGVIAMDWKLMNGSALRKAI